MTRTRISIDGMHCASCVARVEKAIRQVPGVQDARVNLATHLADVDHDEAEGSAEQLAAAIRRVGYDAAVEQKQSRSSSHDHAHHHHPQAANPPWHKHLALLAIPVVVLGMGWMSNTSAWIQLALATPIQVLMGYPFYKRSLKALRHGRADMDSLVAIGTTVAFIYSAVVTFRGGHMVYFDSAVVILVLISLGKYLETRATTAAGSAIGELMSLQPGEALKREAGQEISVPIDEVRAGDTLIVKPGSSVPVDGKVTEGKSSIDQALITGESMPVEVTPGSEVYAGTVNQSGAFEMEATETGEGMLLSQITEAVRDAQSSKANIQRLADKVAGVFVPAVLLIALGTYVFWAVNSEPSAYMTVYGMKAAIAVLIVACPCALGLATPTAIMVGSGLGAKDGILIKDAASFERAGKLTHILFDKTGTLTRGRPAVTAVELLDGAYDKADILRLAAAVEAKSEHPLARAIARAAEQEGLDAATASEFESLPGGAVRGRVEGKVVIVGRVQTLKDASVELGAGFEAKRQAMFEQGQTAAAVSIDNQAVALIGFADELRDEAPEAIGALKALGLRTVMVTGDHRAVADAIARRAGIDRVYADCRPDDKHKVIEDLRRDGHRVAMVGDGINDAPALAAADLGIAVGGGTDIAKDAGHIVLVGADLMNVPRAVRLSRATMKRIWIGLGWAFAYNVLLIPVAVAGLLHPMLAGAAMAASSVSVVGNALWLRRAWRG